MVTGTTKSGFSFEVDEKTADNMELLEILEEMSNNDILAMSKACKIILGDEQKKALYKHLRTEDGRVPVESVSEAVADVLNALGGKGKNS